MLSSIAARFRLRLGVFPARLSSSNAMKSGLVIRGGIAPVSSQAAPMMSGVDSRGE